MQETRSLRILCCLTLLLVATSGCAMCANPFDECYSAYGGSRPRADMLAGRVGSAFVDAGQWSEFDGVPAQDGTSEIVLGEPAMDGEFVESLPYEEEGAYFEDGFNNVVEDVVEEYGYE